MGNADRKGLALVLAVLAVVIVVHVVSTILTRPIVRTWSMPATAVLDFAAPCATAVTITPDAHQGNFSVIAKAKHRGELENLASGAAPGGSTSIGHAADCPDQPTLTLAVTLPPGTSIVIDDPADTDYRIGPEIGALTLVSAGSGDVHAASTGNLSARLAGSGDLDIGSVTGDITANLTDSGDLQIDKVAARTTVLNLLGDGDTTLSTGSAGALLAKLDGTGDLSADSTRSADLTLSADGDVAIGTVAGGLHAALSSDGDLKIDDVAGDATLNLSGDGDATISHLAGHLTQTRTGDGNLHVNGS